MQAATSIEKLKGRNPTSAIATVASSLLANNSGLSETEQLMEKLIKGMASHSAQKMLLWHLGTGGKRIRARLALATQEALGGDRSQAIAWATAVELLHNASLIHDDIQDGDQMRRGEPTLWAIYGKAQAINAGDLLLMLPFLAINEVPADADIRAQLATLLAKRAADTVSGQVEELRMLPEDRLSFTEYIAMVRKKTGELLALSVEGAALIAGKRSEDAKAMAEQFVDLGTLFQLQDDILDLYGDKGRGFIGSDLYEGKPSALVVAHLMAHPEDHDWLTSLLKQERETTPELEVKRAIECFRKEGALDHVISFMNNIIDRLHRSTSLKQEPELHSMALQLTARAMKPIRHVLEARHKENQSNPSMISLQNPMMMMETPC